MEKIKDIEKSSFVEQLDINTKSNHTIRNINTDSTQDTTDLSNSTCPTPTCIENYSSENSNKCSTCLGNVTASLTDFYQISMNYALFKQGKDKLNQPSVFEMTIRKNPFQGEYTVFAGLNDILEFLSNFSQTQNDQDYLRNQFPQWEEEFFIYLKGQNCKEQKVYSIHEGSVIFPYEPFFRIEGPLGLCQLIETPILVLVNYATLLTTNSVRYRLACSKRVKLLEFGTRRAQGPNGALSASKYTYIGGFDSTSNVKAGILYNIPLSGTMAHSFIVSYTNNEQPIVTTLCSTKESKYLGSEKDLYQAAQEYRKKVDPHESTITSEQIAFISFAIAFPKSFVVLIDTYDTQRSGQLNYITVALALHDFGYEAKGIRIDSGDLLYLSKVVRETFLEYGNKFNVPYFERMLIIVSNDINENIQNALCLQKHEIDIFGIGTHLVTCYSQPSLGGIYKLVQVNNEPRMKLSQDIDKVTIPGCKHIYRFYNKDDIAIIDYMTFVNEVPPIQNTRILCRHPFDYNKRCYVTPHRIELLHQLVFNEGTYQNTIPRLNELRKYVQEQFKHFRQDHIRYLNPTPYKVSVSDTLFNYMHKLWQEQMPILDIVS